MGTRRSPYDWCETDILQQVIQPKLDYLVNSTKPTSKQQLWNIFVKEYEAGVSYSKFCEWLDKLGYQIEKVLVITRPGYEKALAELKEEEDLPPAVTEDVPYQEAPTTPVVRRGPQRPTPVPGVGGLVPEPATR